MNGKAKPANAIGQNISGEMYLAKHAAIRLTMIK